MIKKRSGERTIEILIHFCVWAYVFASPLITKRFNEDIDWVGYFRRLYFPITSCIIFYANYLWLVPRFILTKRYTRVVLYNAVIIALLMLSRDLYTDLVPPLEEASRYHHKHYFTPSPLARAVFIMRQVLSLVFMAFVATVVRLSLQWKAAEAARREAELARSEAELQNLKNQINPHFLLNTLNNIYALTAFDPDKAQQAIQELSRMLRYMLYENQAPHVSLRKEADFLRTYVELMRIRLTDNVDIRLEFDIPEGDGPEVAPLIFISLVENAFKHGISPTHASFIHLTLTVSEAAIRFECRNSNFPKTERDKSPGGIGLRQVGRRLEHTYPGRHVWQKGLDPAGEVYTSIIVIDRR